MKYILAFFLFTTIYSCHPAKNKISFREFVSPTFQSISPTMASLYHLKGDKLEKAINDLLSKGKNNSFPLVEKDPLFSDYQYVTFLYKDTAQLKSVRLNVFGNDDKNLDRKELIRLHNTNLFYYTLMLPSDICFSYRYELIDSVSEVSRVIVDPLNNNRIPTGDVEEYSWSVFELPVEKEKKYFLSKKSISSKIDTFSIYSNILHNERDIYIYLPEEYHTSENQNYPVIYLFDSYIYLNRVEVPHVLDHLISEGEIDPIVAVMIDNATSTSRFTELPLNPDFKDFFIYELIPHVQEKYNVSYQKEDNIIGGMSYGGLAATYIAFHHPDVVGKVLSNSGSFWRDTTSAINTDDQLRNDWLTKQFLTKPKKDIKLYLDWGLQENKCFGSNRRFVKVLDSLNYDFTYTEFNGWHDWANARKTFPKGLMYLMNDE